ncbi:hypothetical protein [Nocardia puris]|uniref:hypothetical protein n=1 Tax=Nocardia puris TaxID=208602 RepID=UPI0012F48B53|nr:hypothetical protein [Nocardia puris]
MAGLAICGPMYGVGGATVARKIRRTGGTTLAMPRTVTLEVRRIDRTAVVLGPTILL